MNKLQYHYHNMFILSFSTCFLNHLNMLESETNKLRTLKTESKQNQKQSVKNVHDLISSYELNQVL